MPTDPTNAPERIWVSTVRLIGGDWFISPITPDDISYTRTDLLPGTVEQIGELVEACKPIYGFLPDLSGSKIEIREVIRFVRALTALTEKGE